MGRILKNIQRFRNRKNRAAQQWRELASAVKIMRELCENNAPNIEEEFQTVNQIVTGVSQRLKNHNLVEELQAYQ